MLTLIAAALFSQVETWGPPAELRWLARHQSPEGWWGTAPYCCTPVPVAKSTLPRDGEVAKKVLPLIDGLAADTLDARNRAGEDLLKIGTPAIPFLDDAVDGAGDFEQKQRAANLIRALAGPCREPDLEATSLALLTFMGAGYCHLSKDEYQEIVFGTLLKNSLKWLIARQGENGAFDGTSGPESTSPGGVLAVFAMSEAYGMTGTQLLKGPAEKGVAHLLACQRKSGAWGQGKDDLVTTIYALMALKSAHISDIPFDIATAQKAGDWILGQSKDETPLQLAGATIYSVFFTKLVVKETWRQKLMTVDVTKLDPVTRYLVHLGVGMTTDNKDRLWTEWREKMLEIITKSREPEGCSGGSPKGSLHPTRDSALNMMIATFTYYTISSSPVEKPK